MRCKKAQEFLSLEMDGLLPPDAIGDLDQHIDSCAECRQYRSDLLVGRRLLEATEPVLPENFDWKLQLRLSQTLKEAAAEAAYPWHEKVADRWSWLRNFGTAASVGMAAVLALAMFLGPVGRIANSPGTASGGAALQATATTVDPVGDRLPLASSFRQQGVRLGGGLQLPVAGSRLVGADRGWAGGNIEDLKTIYRLREQNRQLNSLLLQTQRQMQVMRTRLDTTGRDALDLPEDQ